MIELLGNEEPKRMIRILIIDDDIEMCRLLHNYLTKESYEVETIHNGNDGLKKAL